MPWVFLEGRLDMIKDQEIARARQTRRIHEHKQEIGFLECFHRRTDHATIQQMLRLVQSRSIQQRDLCARSMHHTKDPRPGRLRFFRDNGNFLVQEAIQQR
jgi:hypothetical protein